MTDRQTERSARVRRWIVLGAALLAGFALWRVLGTSPRDDDDDRQAVAHPTPNEGEAATDVRLTGRPRPESDPRDAVVAERTTATSGDAIDPPASLRVTVRGWLGVPLEGARVHWEDHDDAERGHGEGVTGPDGVALLAGVHRRAIALDVTHDGYLDPLGTHGSTWTPASSNGSTSSWTVVSASTSAWSRIRGRPSAPRGFGRERAARPRCTAWIGTSGPATASGVLPRPTRAAARPSRVSFPAGATASGSRRRATRGASARSASAFPTKPTTWCFASRAGGRVVARVLDSRGEAVVRARVAFVPKRDAEPAPAPESPETTPEPGEEEDLDRELGGLSVGVGSFFGPRQVEIYSANTDDRGEAVVEGLPFDRTFTVAVAQDPLLGSEAPVAKVTLAREDPDRTLELRVPPWAPQLVDLDEVTESVLSDAGVSPAPTDRRAEVRPRVQWPLGATPE